MNIPIINSLLSYLQGDGAVILPEIELLLFGLGILLIDFALQRQRGGLSALEAVREACLERFRPIIMTTLAAPGGATRLR